MASPGAAEGEGVELEATVTEEVVIYRGQEEEALAEEGLPEEYPAILVATRSSTAPDIRPTQ